MGGISSQYPFLEDLEERAHVTFIVPGGAQDIEAKGNLRLLPHRSGFFHPDLVHASDGVIGKVGYSTLAEVFQAGVPFGYIARPDFRESPCLASFIEEKMPGTRRKFYQGFLKNRDVLKNSDLKNSDVPENSTPGLCGTCGAPTYAEVCSFCRLKEKVTKPRGRS